MIDKFNNDVKLKFVGKEKVCRQNHGTGNYFIPHTEHRFLLSLLLKYGKVEKKNNHKIRNISMYIDELYL